MRPIRETCTPRPEVLKGDLEDAIFAADFGHIVEGIAARVYQDAETFFRNTHPAASLKKVVTTIFDRLAHPDDSGAVIRLSTGFGGGKTHTLIALWHLAQNITNTTLGTELLPAAGRPKQVKVVGIDGGKFLQTNSLWGELALTLGGEAGYAKLAAKDTPTTVPNAALVRAMLPDAPLLILIDELVIYMASLNEQEQGALLGFLNLLIAEVGARRQAVLVVTDPADQPAYAEQAGRLATVTRQKPRFTSAVSALSEQLEASHRLDGVLGRKMSDYDPIGDESAQVIIRRLFEGVDAGAASEASAEYFNTYERVLADSPDVLPPEAAKLDYAQRIQTCYPFHPRLLETAQNRLGALQDFHKGRGTLRLFARILRDIWERDSALPLITAGDLDWTSDRIQSDLLQRLNRDHFKSAVDADVVRHAGQLDADFSTDIHRRVASALLLESLPMNPNAAMDKRDLTLAVLRPSDVGHEPGEAMDRLMRVCWHMYKDSSGLRFQFRYEPNVNKLVEEQAEGIPPEDARQSILTLAQNYFKGHIFTPVAYPGSPQSVPDSADLKLVLCETEALAQAICDYEDNSNPQALRPRRFRNAIFGIAPSPTTLEHAVQVRRKLLAAEAVLEEQKRIGKKTPLREQVEELLTGLRKQAHFHALRAFNRVIFQGRSSITLEEKYLVSDEGALSGGMNGQAKLKALLDDKVLLYQPTDAIDTDLLRMLVKGATPSLEHSGAYSASAVHERGLASDRLRLMLSEDPVRNAILKAVERNELVVRTLNGDAYDQSGCVAGDEGKRKRMEGQRLKTLKLSANVLVALPDAPCVLEWLKEDTPDDDKQKVISIPEAATFKYTSPERVETAIHEGLLDDETRDGQRFIVKNHRFDQWFPTVPPEVTAYTWDEAITYAAKRPLLELTLKIRQTRAANKLLVCAQPFRAQEQTLSVLVSGELKDGGTLNFAAKNLKVNSALKPIDTAQRLLRAATDDATFETTLTLTFDSEGAEDTSSTFATAATIGFTDIHIAAKFGREKG